MGDRYHLVQADLAEILQLVLSYHGADRQPQKFGRREPMLGEKRHANVSGEIQVRAVGQMPVEIHRPPAGQELPRVTLSGFFDHALPRTLFFCQALERLYSPPPVGCMLRNRCGKGYFRVCASQERGGSLAGDTRLETVTVDQAPRGRRLSGNEEEPVE